MLELIARIKKWYEKDNFVEMVYYGVKLAEHVKRLVIEVNGPIAVKSENNFLETHFKLPKQPKDFEKLYLTVNRYTANGISAKEYRNSCITLVQNTADFLLENKEKVDVWTLDLLTSSIFKEYLYLGSSDNKNI